MGAADHRAVPRGTPGRRAGGLPAGPGPAGRRARPRSRTAAAAARAADPRPRPGAPRPGARPGTCRRCRPSSSGARRRSPPSPTCSQSKRLVEIVGPGGIGKTAVAIATGRRLSEAPGGVWLARLEAATTADDVLDTLIAALNVTGGEAALFERLKGAAAVVILDNCEHVVDAAAALAVRLLDAAPGLRILCTSQVPLDVDGEAVFELAPLALADAVELFTRRAAARRGERADDAVRDLCRSLDGLPLAIELAAARTRTLSIEEITRRLDDRFSVLSDPTSRRPERRRALKATIGWSYELLFPDDQRGLWALATFAGGAPLPAVESVLEALDVPASAAIDVVGRLASRSLVIVDDDGAVRVPAARQHPRVRARGDDRGRADRARPRRARRLVRRRGRRAPRDGVRSGRQAEHLAFARAERANIDAALAWSAAHDPLLALGIVNGFGWAWIVLGDSRGAQRILAALDAAGDAAPARDRAGALLLAAWIEASTGHLELAREHIAAATALADAIGDVDLQARCCYYLAYVVSHHGEFAQALELTDRSSALYDGLDRPWDQAANWLFAARAAISAGDRERAAAARDQVAALAADGRRPVAARPPRGDARRAGPHRAPLRRRRPPPRPRRGDVGPARLPADRGLPALQPRARAVPGRRLRDRRGHAGARDREGRGDRRRAPGGARPRAPRARPARARTGRSGAGGARGGDRVAPRRRRRRAGRARRVPAGGARRRDGPGASTARRDPRRRPPRRRRPGRGLRARRARPHRRRRRRRRQRRAELCEAADRRMEAAVALHHRARPDRSPPLVSARRTPAARR